MKIVNVEVTDRKVTIFHQLDNGEIATHEEPYSPWLLSNMKLSNRYVPLRGEGHYKYLNLFDSKKDFWDARREDRKAHAVFDDKEAALILCGLNYYHGLDLKDLTVLAFDIEARGLKMDDEAEVFVISNVFKRGSTIERKLFARDEFANQGELLTTWCDWVREVDPSVIAGHNVFSYDLPYLKHCADFAGVPLRLGRDGSVIEFDRYTSKFRKDGSQFYHYQNAHIYGRDIFDTLFGAIKSDTSRRFSSYALKTVVKEAGLEREGRQHYDASVNRLITTCFNS